MGFRKDFVWGAATASYQIEDALKLSGTKVLMKSGSKLSKVKAELMDKGCRAVMIENCGMEGEAVYTEVENFPETGSYYSIIIVKPEYKAVVFDMDGVIFDSERIVYEGWKELSEKYGFKDLDIVYRKCISVNIATCKQIYLDFYGEDFPYDRYREERAADYQAKYSGGRLPMKPGVEDILAYLKERGFLIFKYLIIFPLH